MYHFVCGCFLRDMRLCWGCDRVESFKSISFVTNFMIAYTKKNVEEITFIRFHSLNFPHIFQQRVPKHTRKYRLEPSQTIYFLRATWILQHIILTILSIFNEGSISLKNGSILLWTIDFCILKIRHLTEVVSQAFAKYFKRF